MIASVFQQLLRHYGPQGWWPADTPLEVMVGAVLVQRTAWSNAARAVDRIKSTGRMNMPALLALPEAELEELIKPAGFARVKRVRLLNLLRFVADAGGTSELSSWPTGDLRERLLDIHGVGPESADAILLYAFQRPVFVVDAYARRLFTRLHWPRPCPPDQELKAASETTLADASAFNEFHALIVEHGKQRCASVPQCEPCCLRSMCAYALQFHEGRRARG